MTKTGRKYHSDIRNVPMQIMLTSRLDKIVRKLAREYKLTRSTMGLLMIEVAIKIAEKSDLTK